MGMLQQKEEHVVILLSRATAFLAKPDVTMHSLTAYFLIYAKLHTRHTDCG